jgi:hypothetical protein
MEISEWRQDVYMSRCCMLVNRYGKETKSPLGKGTHSSQLLHKLCFSLVCFSIRHPCPVRSWSGKVIPPPLQLPAWQLSWRGVRATVISDGFSQVAQLLLTLTTYSSIVVNKFKGTVCAWRSSRESLFPDHIPCVTMFLRHHFEFLKNLSEILHIFWYLLRAMTLSSADH